MYSLRPIITKEKEINLPKCMYKVNNIHGASTLLGGLDCAEIEQFLSVSEQKQVADMEQLEVKQQEVLKHIAELKLQMMSMKETLSKVRTHTSEATKSNCTSDGIKQEDLVDVVLLASPTLVPYSLLAIQNLWAQNQIKLEVKSYVHSSINTVSSELEEFIKKVTAVSCAIDLKYTLQMTLIWKDVASGMELMLGPTMSSIQGEVNVLRYLSRVVPIVNYENSSKVHDIDVVLDICYRLSKSSTVKEKQSLIRLLNAKLGKNTWICSTDDLSLADVAASSLLKQMKAVNDLTINMTNWSQRCFEIAGF